MESSPSSNTQASNSQPPQRPPWPSGTTRRRLGVFALLCTIFVMALGSVVSGVDGPLGAEQSLINHVSSLRDDLPPISWTPPSHWPLVVALGYGDPVILLFCMVGLVIVALRHGDKRLAIVCVIAPLCAGALTEFVGKPYYERLFGHHHALSYPSGHSTGAGVLSGMMFLTLGRIHGPGRAWRMLPLLALPVLATGTAVVVAHWHYPTDAFGGWAVGIGSAAGWAAVLLHDRDAR